MAYMDSAISSLPLAAVCHATIIYRRQCKECSCCNAAAALKWGNMAANPMQPANTKQMEPASCYLDLPSLPNPGIQRHVRSQRDLPTRREIDSMDAMNGDQPLENHVCLALPLPLDIWHLFKVDNRSHGFWLLQVLVEQPPPGK
mmetsp:Transcript_30231/g.85425  ORF Transcript_30231/g.85425 Transcript_30231/m.85425 type:complete len:144 (+) Transcript_30231:3081-3512(+)